MKKLTKEEKNSNKSIISKGIWGQIQEMMKEGSLKPQNYTFYAHKELRKQLKETFNQFYKTNK